MEMTDRAIHIFGIVQSLGQAVIVIPRSLLMELEGIENDPNLSPGRRRARRMLAIARAMQSGVITAVTLSQMLSHGAPEVTPDSVVWDRLAAATAPGEGGGTTGAGTTEGGTTASGTTSTPPPVDTGATGAAGGTGGTARTGTGPDATGGAGASGGTHEGTASTGEGGTGGTPRVVRIDPPGIGGADGTTVASASGEPIARHATSTPVFATASASASVGCAARAGHGHAAHAIAARTPASTQRTCAVT